MSSLLGEQSYFFDHFGSGQQFFPTDNRGNLFAQPVFRCNYGVSHRTHNESRRHAGTLNIAFLANFVLDGEIVCLGGDGKPNFTDLLFRRGEPRFMSFDILWSDGNDLRNLPLIERKNRLRELVPTESQRLLYCDHVEGDGHGLFSLACEHDLEGIVAKRKPDPYSFENSGWLKIRNSEYSQWIDREELFERERETEPSFNVWTDCVRACEDLE